MHEGMRRLIALLTALAVVLAVSPLTPANADADPPVYVALGDSFAAGPLIPLQELNGCLRSTNNYAKLLAARLGAELRDATCSGADTDDMTNAQGVFPQANPP